MSKHKHEGNLPVVKIVDEKTGEEHWWCADCLEEALEKGEISNEDAAKRVIEKLRKLEKEQQAVEDD